MKAISQSKLNKLKCPIKQAKKSEISIQLKEMKGAKKEKVKATKKVDSDDEVNETVLEHDYMIKPSKNKATLDTSEWPLLLKVTSPNIPLITHTPLLRITTK